MFTTIQKLKQHNVNLDSQRFWAPETAAHSAHSKQKKKQPVPVPTPALTLKEDSSSDVKMNSNHLPAVLEYHSNKPRTVLSNAAYIIDKQNEDAEGTCYNMQEAYRSQSVDMLLLADGVTTSFVKPPPDETESFESIIERGLKSPSMVFDSVDMTREPGWKDLPIINQAAEEAAMTSNRPAEQLPISPPTPPASSLSQADKASQSIIDGSVHSVNCLPTSSTPAQIDSIPAAPSACSLIQLSPGSSAEQGIDANGDGLYCVGSEPCQSIKPLQQTEDSHIPSSLNHSAYGHSFTHDDMSGVGSYDNDDDSNDGDGSSYAHNDAQSCEITSSEDRAADYDCDQPPRKRIKVRKSLATNMSSRGSRFPASTELVKQMGKIIPSSNMLRLASSLTQDASDNEDTRPTDAIIYEEVTFSGRLRFSCIDGTNTFQMQWEFPQDTEGSQESISTHTIDAGDSQESISTHTTDAEDSQESSITHPLHAEGRQESRITRRTFRTTHTRPTRKNTRQSPHIPFSRKEEEFLTRLKEGKKKLSWKDIHRKFSKQFPGRSCASLQVRYSTKLKKHKEVQL